MESAGTIYKQIAQRLPSLLNQLILTWMRLAEPTEKETSVYVNSYSYISNPLGQVHRPALFMESIQIFH